MQNSSVRTTERPVNSDHFVPNGTRAPADTQIFHAKLNLMLLNHLNRRDSLTSCPPLCDDASDGHLSKILGFASWCACARGVFRRFVLLSSAAKANSAQARTGRTLTSRSLPSLQSLFYLARHQHHEGNRPRSSRYAHVAEGM